MFASKYDEDLQPYLGEFVTSVWNLLTTIRKAPKFDLLISSAINFLSCVASKDPNRNLFEVPDVLDGICKRVVLPNIEFRLTDEELFETMLASYAADPAKNWRNKDAAIYLVIALASKGATQKYEICRGSPLCKKELCFKEEDISSEYKDM
ncbi:hypothetical protein QYM36_018487, partial [Artemia franciscana]